MKEVIKDKLVYVGNARGVRPVYYLPQINKYWIAPTHFHLILQDRREDPRLSLSIYRPRHPEAERVTKTLFKVSGFTPDRLMSRIKEITKDHVAQYGLFAKKVILRNLVEDYKVYKGKDGSGNVTLRIHTAAEDVNGRTYVGICKEFDVDRTDALIEEAKRRTRANRAIRSNRAALSPEKAFLLTDTIDGIPLTIPQRVNK